MSSKTENGRRLPPNQNSNKANFTMGTDHPGITFTNPSIDTNSYILTVDGEVKNPREAQLERGVGAS